MKDRLEKTLSRILLKESAHLGDRSRYVGASEVVSCPRKVVISKKESVSPRGIQNMIRLWRGHVFEDLIAEAIPQAERQREFSHPEEPRIKAHVDFFYETPKAGYILEIKTSSGLYLKPEYVKQVTLQTGLARLNLAKPVEATVLVADLNEGLIELFRVPFDEKKFRFLVKRAFIILKAFENGHLPDPETGPWCVDCIGKDGCPKWDTSRAGRIENPSLESLALKLKHVRDTKKELEKEEERLRNALLEILKEEGVYRVGKTVINIAKEERPRLDIKRLKVKEPEIWEKYKTIISYYTISVG